MFLLAKDTRPEGPTDRLCPSEEPKEAMAARGPDGRMVPTRTWRAQTPNNHDATGLLFDRTLPTSRSKNFSHCSN
jgi:hypothetical protein